MLVLIDQHSRFLVFTLLFTKKKLSGLPGPITCKNEE